jgi:hypothetical protein
MKMSRWITVSILFTLLLASSSASAFDGLRQGFVLGGGLGLGVTSAQQELSGGPLTISGDREGFGALATTFKIGLGLNERTLLIYQQNQNWFNMENALGSDVTIASGAGVIAVNHYLSEEGSVYLVGGLGVGTWALPFEDGASSGVGGALLLGMGINFNPHWSVEFNLSFGNPSDSDAGVTLDTNTANISATVMGLAF